MVASSAPVKTGVDALIDLLKTVDSISVDKAAAKLKIADSLLQSWIDLLVEESIIGIEYKFITPYIHLLHKDKSAHDMHDDFYEKAIKKGIPKTRIAVLWKQYLLNHMEVFQKDFYDKALRHGYAPAMIDKLWKEYHKQLLFVKVEEVQSK